MSSACPVGDTDLFLKSSVPIFPSSSVLTPPKLPGLVCRDRVTPINDLLHFCRWRSSLYILDLRSLNLSSLALPSCGSSLRSNQMGPRRALGNVHFILRCYTDIVELEILSNVDDHHGLSHYPLVYPCKAPVPYVRNSVANNDLRCCSYRPSCHQGV